MRRVRNGCQKPFQYGLAWKLLFEQILLPLNRARLMLAIPPCFNSLWWVKLVVCTAVMSCQVLRSCFVFLSFFQFCFLSYFATSFSDPFLPLCVSPHCDGQPLADSCFSCVLLSLPSLLFLCQFIFALHSMCSSFLPSVFDPVLWPYLASASDFTGTEPVLCLEALNCLWVVH